MENKIAEKTVSDIGSPELINDSPTTLISVIQEEIVVDKYIVEKGKVRVSKRISEHEETIDEPVFHEEVRVERVPVNKVIDVSPSVRQEGDTLIIPVVEERVFVEKRLVLVEEIRVRKEVVESHQPLKIKLLKEQVEINRVAGNQTPAKHTQG